MRKEEIKRLIKMSVIEKRLRENGFCKIAGIDEAGRGPLAGPVVVCACILPEDFLLENLNDSKLLTPTQRKQLFDKLTKDKRVIYSTSVVDAKTIDEINILQATILCMKQAIEALPITPDYLIFDGKQFPSFPIPSEGIIHGDSLSVSIAAASIIAKETRDRLMDGYHKIYPLYGFDQHKGYGTKRHKDAIVLHGPSEIHRKSFEPVKSYLLLSEEELSNAPFEEEISKINEDS